MSGSLNIESGAITYSNESIANLIGLTAMECYGVVGMASQKASDGLWELLKKENLSKGIKIDFKENVLFVEIYIIVEYGTKINVIAENIITKVKYNIENFTGLTLGKIEVNVQGVRA